MVTRARYRRQPLFGGVHPETRRAVLCVRYSSDMQRESWSVDAQLADLRRYGAQPGWEVAGEFIDAAKSGKNDQRPAFQQALATIRDGTANVMVVHKIDRFSRNMEDTFRLVHEFEEGVDFVKIDRGVVVKALTDRAARGVQAGIVAIARETDTYVIAEGIEDQTMLDLVSRVGLRAGSGQDGVQGVQGYLLGRPSETIPVPTIVETYRTFLHAA